MQALSKLTSQTSTGVEHPATETYLVFCADPGATLYLYRKIVNLSEAEMREAKMT